MKVIPLTVNLEINDKDEITEYIKEIEKLLEHKEALKQFVDMLERAVAMSTLLCELETISNEAKNKSYT